MPFRGANKKPWVKKPFVPSGKPVSGDGPLPASVMLIGERPGKDEDKQGRPFVGVSGQELDRYLDSINIFRDEIYITNLVKTYADHPPTKAEIAQWEVILSAEIEECRPDYIGAVGAHAAEWLLGKRYIDMDTQHAVAFDLVPPLPPRPPIPSSSRTPDLSGSQVGHSPLVMPIYHPAAAFYDPEIGRFVQYDFQMFGAMIKGEVKPKFDEFPSVTYIEDRPHISPSDHLPLIAIDTEGSRKSPWCLTWSADPGEAFCNRRLEGAWRKLHEAKTHILLHNSLHDLSIVDIMGCPIRDDQFTDTMVLAYLLGVEPQGLKALAFRHCGMEMKSYDELMSSANQSVALEYIHGLMDTDWGETEPYALYVKGELKIKKPWSLNRYIDRLLSDWAKNSELDVRKRWNNIDGFIRERAQVAVGDMPEATLDDIPASDAVHYACRDADATLRIYPILQSRVKATGQELVQSIDHSIIPMVNRMQIVGMAIDFDHFPKLANKCENIMAEQVAAIEKITGSVINPDSPDQTRELLFEVLGLEPIKWTKGGEKGEPKESTQDKVLEALRFAHPVVPHILDYREASKVRNSFCLSLPRRAAGDGRIHANIRVTRVSSGRLATNTPNLMAIPVRSDLGREVRAGFIAGRGRCLATWDLNQIEMRHMAEESKDPILCGLFASDDRDVHVDTAANMFDVPYEVAELKENKMRYRYPAKRVGFGVITGITGMGLLDQMKLANTGVEWTEASCDNLIERWFQRYPAVRSYMEGKRAETRRYGYVRDMWGRIRLLPSVHSPIPRIREEACRQSHSHSIQAGAQGIIKVAMAKIWRDVKELQSYGWWVEPLLQIHDELLFEMDDDPLLWELMNEMVVRHLTTALLDFFPEYGVRLKAAGVKGYRWSELEK